MKAKPYIDSPAWRLTRIEYWSSNLPKECYLCQDVGEKPKDLHIKPNVFSKSRSLSDLVPLCFQCHKLVLRAIKKNKASGKGPTLLWKAIHKYRREYAALDTFEKIVNFRMHFLKEPPELANKIARTQEHLGFVTLSESKRLNKKAED